MADTETMLVVEESREGGYEAEALGRPIYTQADSLEQLKRMVGDAVHCHFEEEFRPRVIRLQLGEDEVIPA